MADKVSLRKLRRWIPDLSNYWFTEAKRHCLVHGRGAPVPSVSTPGIRVSTAPIDHFIAFITNAHTIQDLPFGEQVVTLSSRQTIKVPNVIHTMILERIVKQYFAYCDETGFKPLSRSTLVRILNVCPASVRKSLQGLDYIYVKLPRCLETQAKVWAGRYIGLREREAKSPTGKQAVSQE